jgi:hypothetical protein
VDWRDCHHEVYCFFIVPMDAPLFLRRKSCNLATSSDWWSPTADKLFLGVYSKHGGREFRLNKGIEFSQSNKEYVFGLGTPCCLEGSDVPLVEHSTSFGVNDPLLNPIELSEVDFVYLRKETDGDTPNNDDWMKLNSATILLCDSSGGLRRFRKTRNINFCDKWSFEFGLKACGKTRKVIEHGDRKFHNNPPGGDDDWHELVDQNKFPPVYIDCVGCCGSIHDLELFGSATEYDFWSRDDKGSSHDHVKVVCGGEKTVGSVDFTVKGQNKRRKSRIRLHYEVTAVCLH